VTEAERAIFRDAEDHADFLARLAVLV